jgi:uncharacterized protein (DUF1778 family)
MDIEIEVNRRKTKLIGVRLYKEEYDLIATLAKEKKTSRSFVAESLLRAAIGEVKSRGTCQKHA